MAIGPHPSIAVGLNKGYPTQRIPKRKQKSTAHKCGKKILNVRNIIKEIAGVSPYEKRMMDIIKAGGNTAEKRVYKFAKHRLGTHKRALAKREEIKILMAEIRKKLHHEQHHDKEHHDKDQKKH